MTTIDETLAERGSRYGEFPEHAMITQAIKGALTLGENWDELDDDMREAMEMVAHKFGRILNGDPEYIDSWTDCIGYLRLVEKRLIDEQTPQESSKADIERDQAVRAALEALVKHGVITLVEDESET
jgi:hypothetical protein